MVIAFILLVAVMLGESSEGLTEPIAVTPLGKVRGHWAKSRGGRDYIAFSGLPYARPPVGQLRFEPPEPALPWRGVREALEDGPWCIQYNTFNVQREVIGSEDCLYLSLYTHNVTGRKPVLVHFHGGGYISGNGARNTGPQYLMDEDLVIVDVNYRVSFFGFLTFEDIDMPGNQGMKDQVMALRWVQQNIASFGGDPKRVTLVGESAGAGSVYHHTVSPLSRGLFHGGIAESGTSYAPWAVGAPGLMRNTTMKLLALLGIKYTNTKDAVSALKNVDAKKIAVQLDSINEGLKTEVYAAIGPTLEPPHSGAFLVGPISRWRHEPVPLILGTTSAEGLIKTNYYNYYNISYEQLGKDFEELGQRSLRLEGYSSEPRKVVKELYKYYFPSGTLSERDWVNLTTLFSDSWFAIGVIDGAKEHSGDVFVYYFDYLGKYSFTGTADERNTTITFGAFHTDEIIYIWRHENFKDIEGEDLKLSKQLVKLWANFATYGNPTPNGSNCKWEKWNSDKFNYFNIDKSGFKMKEGLIRDRYKFWKTLKYRDNLK